VAVAVPGRRRRGVEARNDVGPLTVELAGTGFSIRRERTLEVRDPGGRVLGSTSLGTAAAPFAIGPFVLPGGASRLTLHAAPGPEPLGAGDGRIASVFLSPVSIRPLADESAP
jgi:hypothetical protein